MRNRDFYYSHPISFVNHLRDAFGSDLILGFSRYSYSPRVRKDERERFNVSIGEVTANWLKHQFLVLGRSRELALESRLTLSGRARHIPMLDFRGMTKGQLTAIMEIFPKRYAEGLHVYFSGRSYHAYFPQLLTPSQWIKFMGSALLCNTPNDPSIVDQRWIGHRLIGGYAALRWSCNTPHYKSYPQRINTSDLDSTFVDKLGINVRAQNRIDGLPNKSIYYEELIEWALRDLELTLNRQVVKRIDGKAFGVDFVVVLRDAGLVGIEAVYSDHEYLSRERVKQLRNEAAVINKRGRLSHLVVITNSQVRDTDRKTFANLTPPISIIDGTISPDAALSRMGETLKKIDRTTGI